MTRNFVMTTFVSAMLVGAMLEAAAASEYHHVKRVPRAGSPAATVPHSDGYAALSYPEKSYWDSRVEGGAISAPAGH